MTEKELLYVIDAIGHEKSIIKICEDMTNNLQDKSLITFIEKEIQNHQNIKEKLTNMLEVKANE